MLLPVNVVQISHAVLQVTVADLAVPAYAVLGNCGGSGDGLRDRCGCADQGI